LSVQSRAPRVEKSCGECLRRSWLLARLGPVLDLCAPDRERLFALLGLADEELIEALAGRRRAATQAAYAAWRPESSEQPSRSVCRHREGYPRALRARRSRALLHVMGAPSSLGELTDSPVVVLLGERAASDYGREMATGLARGLSSCGVTVLASAVEGVGAAALEGALEAGSRCVALCGDGLAVSRRGPQGALLARVAREGCAISALAPDASGRIWGWGACELVALELAQLVVVVECREDRPELRTARVAREMGVTLAAVPGRATSPLAAGPLGLLREGARLVCGAEDALELLSPRLEASPRPKRAERPSLPPALHLILDEVDAGRDTPGALTLASEQPLEEILLALTELELLGLLRRSRGGRYIRRL
jgi:DNA processing protein